MEYSINIPDEAYIKEIQTRAEEAGLILKAFDGKKIVIYDFDKNKITLIL